MNLLFNQRLWLHLIFWIMLGGVFFAVAVADEKASLSTRLGVVLYDLCVVGLIVYHNLYTLFPNLLYKSRYLFYFASILAEILLGALMIHYFVPKLFHEPSDYIQGLFFIGFFVVLTSGLKLSRDGIRRQLNVQAAQTKQLQAELNLLKSQVNPHFLFNTLNNLYSLTLEKSDHAPIVVLKLSAIMRYLLESSKQEETDLEKECTFLRDYLELEKLRLNNRANIQFDVMGDISQTRLAPMLLIPFVENAFKHGAANAQGELSVHIHLRVEDSDLYFYVENSKSPQKQLLDRERSGTGLENIQKRLELLYPKKYAIDIEDSTESYCVNLHILIGAGASKGEE